MGRQERPINRKVQRLLSPSICLVFFLFISKAWHCFKGGSFTLSPLLLPARPTSSLPPITFSLVSFTSLLPPSAIHLPILYLSLRYPLFIVEYLINSCGLSSDMAAQASKRLSHLKSLSNPDSVLHFLQRSGFGDAHIAKLVTSHPRFLCAKVEKNLRPKFKALREMGFSESDVIVLVLGCPKIFWYGDLQPKVEFWRRIFGTNENLLKVLKRNSHLLSSSLGKKIMPKIALLRDCGIPDSRIGKILMTSTRFIGQSVDSVKAYIERAENLEVLHSSRMFWQAFIAVVCHSKATVDAKFRLYKSLGWSEAEASSAISKTPKLLHLSDKVVYEKMDFLMKEVGCKFSYVAHRPALLTYSLEGG